MCKKVGSFIMAVVMAFSLSACSGGQTTSMSVVPAASDTEQSQSAETSDAEYQESVPNEKLPFKIGFMVSPIDVQEEIYRYAEQIQKKYGEEKIIIDTFTAKATVEQEVTISKIMSMAVDPDIRIIVLHQADVGTIAAIKKLREKRPDIYVVACNPNEDIDQVAVVADLLLNKDQRILGEQIAKRAADAGAKTFVHYSFPRHMANQLTALRAQIIKEECEKNGIKFIEATAPDPMGDAGAAGAQQFILEDVPVKVKEMGEDTAFFGTNDAMWDPLVKSCIEQHAIFVTPSDPSPYLAFPAVMGIDIPEDKKGDTPWLLDQISEKTKAVNMEGRLSTWSTSSNYLFINIGVEYAIQHCLGNTNDTDGAVDLEMAAKIGKDLVGADIPVGCMLNAAGKEYKNYLTVCGEMHIFE